LTVMSRKNEYVCLDFHCLSLCSCLYARWIEHLLGTTNFDMRRRVVVPIITMFSLRNDCACVHFIFHPRFYKSEIKASGSRFAIQTRRRSLLWPVILAFKNRPRLLQAPTNGFSFKSVSDLTLISDTSALTLILDTSDSISCKPIECPSMSIIYYY